MKFKLSFIDIGFPNDKQNCPLNFGDKLLYAIPIGIIVIESVFFVASLANLNKPSLRISFLPNLLIFPSGNTTKCSLFSIRSIAYLNVESDGDN